MASTSGVADASESVPSPRVTCQDVLHAPTHRVAEIVDGTLYTHLRPAMQHARASSSLGVKVGGPFNYDAGGPGGWWIVDKPELHFDKASWSRTSPAGAWSGCRTIPTPPA